MYDIIIVHISFNCFIEYFSVALDYLKYSHHNLCYICSVYQISLYNHSESLPSFNHKFLLSPSFFSFIRPKIKLPRRHCCSCLLDVNSGNVIREIYWRVYLPRGCLQGSTLPLGPMATFMSGQVLLQHLSTLIQNIFSRFFTSHTD